MIRRNFLKKLLITTIGILAMSNKLFAKEILSKSVVKDGVFYNNFIGHTGSFKDLWKWRKESTKKDPISFPLAKNDPQFLKNNKIEKTLTWIGHASFLLQLDGILTPDEYKKCLEIGIDGCKQVYEIQKKALQEKYFSSYDDTLSNCNSLEC